MYRPACEAHPPPTPRIHFRQYTVRASGPQGIETCVRRQARNCWASAIPPAPGSRLAPAIRLLVDAERKPPSVWRAVSSSLLGPLSPIQIPTQFLKLQIPELFVVANPVKYFLKASGLQSVNTHTTFFPMADKSRRPQHGQVLRDSRLADTEGCTQVARRQLSCHEQVENAAPCCIRNHMKNICAGGKSVHPSYDITNWLYPSREKCKSNGNRFGKSKIPSPAGVRN